MKNKKQIKIGSLVRSREHPDLLGKYGVVIKRDELWWAVGRPRLELPRADVQVYWSDGKTRWVTKFYLEVVSAP
tara:strand:- start:232 stop:453 length:222 start_codon:yes stop_codon:yes gene_type:complete